MIDHLDHLVLTVRNLDATLAFYIDLLGMKPIRFGSGRWALGFGQQKINLHLVGQEFDPRATHPTPGSADLCFVVTRPVEQVAAQLLAAGIPVIEGPVARTGAMGSIWSIYCRDPDGNLIELANYREPIGSLCQG